MYAYHGLIHVVLLATIQPTYIISSVQKKIPRMVIKEYRHMESKSGSVHSGEDEWSSSASIANTRTKRSYVRNNINKSKPQQLQGSLGPEAPACLLRSTPALPAGAPVRAAPPLRADGAALRGSFLAMREARSVMLLDRRGKETHQSH